MPDPKSQVFPVLLRYGRDQTHRGALALRVPEAGGVTPLVGFTDTASWGRLRVYAFGLA
ncbi:MAG TPA: hypothetical protein VFN94_02275 [Nitrospiria bacterium]|nr:hypothetical protein [Nitrospiria bacterium]